MADVFTVEKRSQIMSLVKGKGNRNTELRLISVFRAHNIKGWRRNARVFGKPDFIFPSFRTAIFVDGCFWHGCPIHGSLPRSNAEFWKNKLTRNKERDLIVNKTLRNRGWTVLRIWQHELRQPQKVARKTSAALQKAQNRRQKESPPSTLQRI